MTATREEIIAHRQAQVRRVIRATFLSAEFQACTRKETTATMEGVAYQRQLTFPKLALFDNGSQLIAHWPLIRRELYEPWQTHYAESNEASWTRIGSQIESTFFSTNKDNFDPIDLGLHGDNGWIPVEETSIPGFAHGHQQTGARVPGPGRRPASRRRPSVRPVRGAEPDGDHRSGNCRGRAFRRAIRA